MKVVFLLKKIIIEGYFLNITEYIRKIIGNREVFN